MPRAISSTAIAPCACASRIKDGRAKNSARPRRGRSIRSIRAGFELFGVFLSLPTQLPKLLAQLWGFRDPMDDTTPTERLKTGAQTASSQPHLRRAEFFALPPRGHSGSLP